jgi:uncharacterized protein (TIRG00374 family)
MRFSTKPFILIGIVLFAYIIYSVGADKIIGTFLSADIFYIALTFPLIVPVVLAKGWKWKILAESLGAKMTIWEACYYWLVGLFAATVTPGRAGDMIRSFYLSKKGMSFGKSLSTVVVDRIFDIVSLVALSVFGLGFIIFRFGQMEIAKYIFIIMLLGAALIAVLLRKELAKNLMKPLFRVFVPQRHKERFRLSFDDFYEGLKLMGTKKGALYK